MLAAVALRGSQTMKLVYFLGKMNYMYSVANYNIISWSVGG